MFMWLFPWGVSDFGLTCNGYDFHDKNEYFFNLRLWQMGANMRQKLSQRLTSLLFNPFRTSNFFKVKILALKTYSFNKSHFFVPKASV